MKTKNVDKSHLLLGIATTHGINYHGFGVGMGVGFKYTQRALLADSGYYWRSDGGVVSEGTIMFISKENYLFPIYTRVVYEFDNYSSFVPAFMMDVGYTFIYSHGSIKARHGFFVEPSLGVKYRIRKDKDVAVSFTMGILCQQYYYRYWETRVDPGSYSDFDEHNITTFFLSYNVKLGIDF